jgi:hypothetical protein
MPILPYEKPTLEVQSDGKMTLEPVDGVGISMAPVAGNAAGYPLRLVVNGDESHPVTVRGPGFLKGPFALAKLEFSGGTEGDLWEVTILPSADAREEQRLSCDMDGKLQVRGAGARTLFDFSTDDAAALVSAWGNGQNGSWYITPANPRVLTVAPALTQAWDLSRFNNCLLVVDQTGSGTGDYTLGLPWEMGVTLEVTHAVDGRRLKTLAMGTFNNFGSNGSNPWNGDPGYIRAGGIVFGALEGLLQEVPDCPAFARFKVTVANSGLTPETLTDFASVGGSLRLRGLAW